MYSNAGRRPMCVCVCKVVEPTASQGVKRQMKVMYVYVAKVTSKCGGRKV